MRICKRVWVTTLSGLLLSAALPATAQIELQLDCPARELRTDPVQILVQAVVPVSTPLGAIEATVSWDVSLLNLAAVATGDFGSPTFRQQEGQLTLATFDAAGATGTVTLARLTFHDLQTISGETQISMAAEEITAAGDFAVLVADPANCVVPLPEAATPLIRLHLVGPEQVLAGDRLTARLVAEMASGVELGAIDASVSWDPALLSLVGAEGEFGSFQQRPRAAGDGVWSFTAFSANGTSGLVELAKLTFETRTDTGGIGEMAIDAQTLTAVSTFADLLPHASLAPYTVAVVRDEAARPPARIYLQGAAEAAPGSILELAVTAQMPRGVALGALDLSLVWDPDQLEFVELRDGDFAPMTTNLSDAEVGSLSMAGFRTEGAEGTVVVGILFLRVVGTDGASSVLIRSGELTAAQTFAGYGHDAVTDPFQLRIIAVNQPPSAAIDAPATGVEVIAGEDVTLQGRGTDPEEGSLDDAMLRWSSSVAGELGTGATLIIRPTQTGQQVITLSVTDAQGERDTASITIQVVAPNQAPTARITTPTTGHQIEAGQSLTLRGTGSDPEEGTLTGGSLRWSSSVSGDLGTGATRAVALVAIGIHRITLIAIDEQGLTHGVSISVTVVETPQEPPAPEFPFLPLGERIDSELTQLEREGRHSYMIEVERRQTLRVLLRADFDGYLRIYEPGQTRHFVSRRERKSFSGTARVTLDHVIAPGRYRVEVASIGDDEIGEYRLTIGPGLAADHDLIVSGESVSGRLNSRGPNGRQTILLETQTARRVRFVMSADFRPWIIISSLATGRPLVEGLASEGTTVLEFDKFLLRGIYRVEITSAGDAQVGAFTVSTGSGSTRPVAVTASSSDWQTYPNPFNSSIAIGFDIETAGQVRLDLYDLLGQRVRTLVDGDRSASSVQLTWDGRDDSGRAVASGVYLLHLTTPTEVLRRRITLLR